MKEITDELIEEYLAIKNDPEQHFTPEQHMLYNTAEFQSRIISNAELFAPYVASAWETQSELMDRPKKKEQS